MLSQYARQMKAVKMRDAVYYQLNKRQPEIQERAKECSKSGLERVDKEKEVTEELQIIRNARN